MFHNKYINIISAYCKLNCCVTASLLLLSIAGFSQKGTGRLAGKITDGSSNESLSGVSIIPKGKTSGTSSITDGSYILSLAPGTYTITYSYTGYQKKEISGIVIKAGESTFFNIVLAQLNDKLEEVVVTSSVKKESQSSLYNAQRISAAASDGISQEAISRTPDIDAGQVLKRVTGINVQDNRFVVVRGLGAQYNQTMLNGVAMTSTETNQNAFSFDLVPASVIDNIVVNKTATPDMPGNFAGGIVQVNTKDFPARDFFSIALQGGFSDKTYNKDFYGDERGNLEWLSFIRKNRDLPQDFPRSTDRANLGNLNQQVLTRYLKMLPNNLLAINHGPSKFNENIQFGFGKTIKFNEKGQFGVVAALTQRKTEIIENEETTRNPSQALQSAFGRLFNQYSQNIRYKYSSELAGVLNLAYSFGNNKITLKNIYSQTYRNTYIKRDSVFKVPFNSQSFNGDSSEIEGFSYLVEQRKLINTILGGEHKTGKNNETKLDWNINITANASEFPDVRNFLLYRNASGNYEGNSTASEFLSILETSSRFWSDSKDFVTGGAFNATTIFRLFNYPHILKGGILFQNRRRTATGTAIPYNSVAIKPLDSVLAPIFYEPNTNSGIDVVGNPIGGSSNLGNYNAASSLQAAYESIENKFGKSLRIIWGIRIENYQQSVNVYTPIHRNNFQEPDLESTKFAARSTFNFLPSINIVYSPISKLNIRAAYSNTVIRPDLKDLAEYTRFDFVTLQLTTGNSELKSTTITNYDVKMEWFPSSGEIISIAGFYKKLIDPIESVQSTVQPARVGSVSVNSGNTTVRGIEVEIRKKIDFVSFAPWLANVTLFGNGSLMDSKVKEGATTSGSVRYLVPEHSLTGQPDYIINFGASVAAFKNSFEATLSYNRSGDYVNQLGSTNLDPQIDPIAGKRILSIPNFIVRARDIVDLGVKQVFLKRKAQIKFNVSNLFGKPLLIYQDFNGNNKYDSPAYVIDRSQAGQGFVISGIDNNSSLTNGQRTYFLSFTYTF